MADFKVKIDGVEQSASDGINAIDFYKDNKDIVVAKINGELKDLATALKANDEVIGIAANSAVVTSSLLLIIVDLIAVQITDLL